MANHRVAMRSGKVSTWSLKDLSSFVEKNASELNLRTEMIQHKATQLKVLLHKK
jgi:hypothetical protein